MSAGVSIIGQCAECCACPTAAVEWDSRSASLNKCGHEEFTSPSSPPKYYLTVTANGSAGGNLEGVCSWSSASVTIDSTDCLGLLSYAGTITAINLDVCSVTFSNMFSAQQWDTDDCGGVTRDRYLADVHLNCPDNPRIEYLYILSETSTSRTYRTCATTNDLTETLSNEYTTALLRTNAVLALPSYPGTFTSSSPGSFANVSSDELSCAVRESRYRLRFKIPLIGFGTCYKVTWKERFTPEGGGTSIDTDRCDIWNGTTPSGYDPDDSTTWPVLPSVAPYYYELPVPSTDGTTTVVSIVAECRDCSACP